MSQRRMVGPVEGGRLPWIGAFLALGIFRSVAPAQAPAPVPDSPAPATSQVSDLSTRYRFIERYSPAVPNGPLQPGEIGQYRVATRDVLKLAVEKEQGAPDRKETTVQVIYTEKPATIGALGGVTALVRRYDAYRISPQPEEKPSATATKPLEGLSVWIQPQPKTNSRPLLISLTENHPLTETEYDISSHHLIYLPDLAGVLPPLPSRVGDRWSLTPAAAQALLGDRPLPKGGSLVGELVDVRKSPDKPEMTAEIKVTGRVLMPPNGSDTPVNAAISFKFTPPAGASTATGTPTTIDARGAITEVRLARSSVSAITGGNGRLRKTLTWELTLQRDLTRPGAPLTIPSKPPVATPANSWITYHDPLGRFQFRHPQDLHPDPRTEPEEVELGFVKLFDDRAYTHLGRAVIINLQPKSGNPEDERNDRDPEFHKKTLQQSWSRDHRDIIPGNAGWLPEADWSPYHMKIYRIEVAERPSGVANKDMPRVFVDYYLILFSQNESMVVTSTTGQDPPPFRKQVEEIIRTITINPSPKPAR